MAFTAGQPLDVMELNQLVSDIQTVKNGVEEHPTITVPLASATGASGWYTPWERTDLIVGEEYEITVKMNYLLQTTGTYTNINVYNGGRKIMLLQGGRDISGSAYLSLSETLKFVADSNTLKFDFNIATTLYGDGTTEVSYYQLKRMNNKDFN